MQDMIRRIIEADNEAKALEEQNRKSADADRQKIEADAKKIYEKYMNEAMETVSRNDAHEEQKAQKQWEEISARQSSAKIKMRSDFEQNRDRWVDELVARVLD